MPDLITAGDRPARAPAAPSPAGAGRAAVAPAAAGDPIVSVRALRKRYPPPRRGADPVVAVDVRHERRRALQHIAAVLEGNRNLYWRLTARENLEYFAGNRGRSRRALRGRIDQLLERFDLGSKRDTLVSSLSRGMQQKLALAVAALADTDVVLLDEPTLGLDVETGYEVRALLREMQREGRTVIVSTHDMPVVQDVCERTVVIAHGRVLADERVDHLLALFASRAYQVELAAPIEPTALRELERRFVQVVARDEGRRLQVELERGEQLYALIDTLREARAPIESLERSTIDFETVFRRLVNGDAPRATA